MPRKNANDTPSVKSEPFTTPQAFHCSPPEPTPPAVQQDQNLLYAFVKSCYKSTGQAAQATASWFPFRSPASFYKCAQQVGEKLQVNQLR